MKQLGPLKLQDPLSACVRQLVLWGRSLSRCHPLWRKCFRLYAAAVKVACDVRLLGGVKRCFRPSYAQLLMGCRL